VTIGLRHPPIAHEIAGRRATGAAPSWD